MGIITELETLLFLLSVLTRHITTVFSSATRNQTSSPADLV